MRKTFVILGEMSGLPWNLLHIIHICSCPPQDENNYFGNPLFFPPFTLVCKQIPGKLTKFPAASAVVLHVFSANMQVVIFC